VVKKNVLKPWQRLMWCIGNMNQEYRQRMYHLCDLYRRPYDPSEPVVCVDEKSVQIVSASRRDLAMESGRPAKQDYEYVRKGTRNLFVAVEPKGGHREVAPTARRTKVDFVGFIQGLLQGVYAGVRKLHLVVDNLNTHTPKVFTEILGVEAAARLLARVEFHYTPKHASWLNMAELEIGILNRQCLGRRFADAEEMEREVLAWQQSRNDEHRCLNWTFSRQDADRKLSRHYVT
jgi:hypothetical protein